jgi:hypothetical protein
MTDPTYLIQKSIVDNHNEFKDANAKLSAAIKRLDIILTSHEKWLELLDKGVKENRGNIKNPPMKIVERTWLDKLLSR